MGERVWVYLEREPKGVSESSLQALSFGAAWAEERGGVLEGVCVGGGPEPLDALPGALSRVYSLSGEGLGQYVTCAYGSALEALLGREQPALLVFPSTTQGEDLASWVGAFTGAGALLGIGTLRVEADQLIATRVEFDGKVAVDYALEGTPAVVTVRESGGEGGPLPKGSPEIVEVPVQTRSGEPSVRVISSEVGQRTVDLRAARAIVAVGAGVGGREGFERARELAGLLGAEIGATRAAVDAGWVAHERQIGQTGVKVKPDLYVACGISGATQHRVGMADAGTIVSINIDPNAPIFRSSHFCVVGDAKVILPKLLELLRR